MTLDELTDAVAINPLVNKNPEDIKEAVKSLVQIGTRNIYRKMPWYWRRVNEHFTLPANTNTIDLSKSFSDISKVRFLWTESGKIYFKSEQQYRRQYPNGMSGNGTPDTYVPLSGQTYLFAPTPSVDTTINLSYIYTPSSFGMEDLPNEFHDLIYWFVMSSFEGTTQATDRHYWQLYSQGLMEMIEDGRQTFDGEIEIIMPSMDRVLSSAASEASSR